jgi:hypothetical protein
MALGTLRGEKAINGKVFGVSRARAKQACYEKGRE